MSRFIKENLALFRLDRFGRFTCYCSTCAFILEGDLLSDILLEYGIDLPDNVEFARIRTGHGLVIFKNMNNFVNRVSLQFLFNF